MKDETLNQITEQDLRQPVPGASTPESFQAFKEGGLDGLEVPLGDSVSAAYERALLDTGLSSILRGRLQSQLENEWGGEKLSPDELNKRFPDMEKPFTQPTSAVVAEYLNFQQQERHRMQFLIENGPKTWMASGLRFGAAAIAGAAEPVALAATGAVAAGVAAVGAVPAAGAGLLATAGYAIGENLIGNTISEAITYYQAQREQQDYSLGDAAVNVGVGSAFIPALVVGAKGAFRGAKSVHTYLKVRNPVLAETTENIAHGQALSDRRVNVEPVINDALAEASGRVTPEAAPQVRSTYSYEPVIEPGKVAERTFYIASELSSGGLPKAASGPIELQLGRNMVYMTDHPAVANGIAGSKWNPGEGRIHEVKISAAKLLDLDQPATGAAKEVLKPYLEKALGSDGVDELLQNTSARELMEMIEQAAAEGHFKDVDDVTDAIGDALKAQGYDGYRFEGGKTKGHEGDPHNVVALFDSEKTGDAGGKITSQGEYEPNRDVIPETDPQTLQKLKDSVTDPKQKIAYDPESVDRFQAASDAPPSAPLESRMKEILDQQFEELELLEKQGALSAESASALKALRELGADDESYGTMFKHAMVCVGSDV